MPIPTREEIQQLSDDLANRSRKAVTPTQKPGITPADLKDLESIHQARLVRERKEAIGERSAITDAAMGVGRGAIDYAGRILLPEARLYEGMLKPGREHGPVGRFATKSIEAIEDFRAKKPWMQPKEGFAGMVSEGFAMTTMSLMSAIPGALAGAGLGALGGTAGGPLAPLTVPAGAAAGFVLGGAVQFGAAQIDDFLNRSDKAGVPREKSEPIAVAAGLVEGGLEGLFNWLSLITFGLSKPLTIPAQVAMKKGIGAVFKVGIKQYAKQAAQLASVEIPTEILQEGIGAELERKIGIGDTRFWDAAKQVIGPTAVSSILFTGFFGSINMVNRKRIKKALTDPAIPIGQRKEAALLVENAVKEVNPELAQVWGHNAFVAIENGEAIEIDESLVGVEEVAPTVPGEEVIEEAPAGTGLSPEEELAATEEDIERIYTPEQLADLEKGVDKKIGDHLNALSKKIANLESLKKRTDKQESNLKAYKEERKTIMEEQGYDKEGKRRLPGGVREGEEPGRPVQEREGGEKAIEAGGIFQTQEGEEIELPGIEFRDDLTPADIEDQWSEMVAIQGQLIEKNAPRLEEIEKELATLKGKRKKPDQEKRKALREEAQELREEPAAFIAGAENSFINAQEDFNDRVIARAKEKGIEDEETQGEIAELAGMMLTERQYIEQTWNWPISKVIDEAIDEYTEGEAEAAPEKPAEEELSAEERRDLGKVIKEAEKAEAKKAKKVTTRKPTEIKPGETPQSIVKALGGIYIEEGGETEFATVKEGGGTNIGIVNKKGLTFDMIREKFVEDPAIGAVTSDMTLSDFKVWLKDNWNKPVTEKAIEKAAEEEHAKEMERPEEEGKLEERVIADLALEEGDVVYTAGDVYKVKRVAEGEVTLQDDFTITKDEFDKITLEKPVVKKAAVGGLPAEVKKQLNIKVGKKEGAAEEAKKKEPWEMTRGEYFNASRFYQSGPHKNLELPDGERILLRKESTLKTWQERSGDFVAGTHEARIKKALSENKPVSPEVLKDYPELQKPAEEAKKKEPTREKFIKDLEMKGVATGYEGETISIQHSDESGYYVRITKDGIRTEKGGDPKGGGWGLEEARAKALDMAGFEEAPEATEKTNPVSEWVADRVSKGRLFVAKDLFDQADKYFGGTQAQGKYVAKDAYELMELGVNQYIKKIGIGFEPTGAVNSPAVHERIKLLKQLVNKLPTQTRRTTESGEFQQFSTPPHLAFVVNWVANLNKDDVVLEPSAGIGGIAVFAKNAGVSKVIVNELSKDRLDLLKQLGFDEYFNENAEQLDNILPDTVKPTVVVMNPPFSATAGRLEGKRDTKFATRHIEQAMARLEPGGRLVAIVGKGMGMNAPAFREWWNKKDYNVRANIRISGKEYQKYGTTFDNRIIVIDKNSKKKDNIITGKVESVEDLLPLLEGIRNERSYQAKREPTKPTGKESAEEGRAGVGREPSLLSTTGTLGTEPGRGEREGEQAIEGERGGPGGLETGEPTEAHLPERERRGQRKRPSETPKTPGPGDRAIGTHRQPTYRHPGKLPYPEGSTGKLQVGEEKGKKEKKALTDSIYDEYTPEKVKIKGAQKHPGKLVESAAMAAVEQPTPTYQPDLPKESIESGKISDAQLEAVVYAGQSHEKTLPTGERRGFFIGDGTGVGKGREAAAIILDNWNKGRKKSIWLSEKQGLIKDAKRDVDGVGWNSKVVFPLNKTKATGKIAQENGVLFTTYDTLKNKARDKGDVAGKRRLDQVAEWLGEDFDGVIVFDESHNMGNAIETKVGGRKKDPSNKALTGVELQRRLPNARVLYVSATGATDPLNLAYATRLGLFGEGTPFPNVGTFVNQIEAQGLAAMELVARDMKAMGKYISRSLSFDGVTYERLEHKLTRDQKDIYNELAGGWQIVLKNVHDALKATGRETETGKQVTGANNGQAIWSHFWSTQQRFFNQVITAMQVPSAIKSAEKDLKDGKSVVFQLVNTMEAAQERALSRIEEGQAIEDLDLTPKQQLMDWVERSFPVQEYEKYKDEDGNERARPVFEADGETPVINKEAVRMRTELLAKIGSIKAVDNPLDQIIDYFGAENVAEVTGRKVRLIRKEGVEGKVEEKLGLSHREKDADAFMDGKKRVLIFSDAGGTGRSYDADRNVKNQQRRSHYVLQPGWRADRAIQGMGRTHRANQAIPPHYVLVHTDLEAQKRFISTIARRLDQLGALTKGQRQTGSQGFFQARDNLESPHAIEALHGFIADTAYGHNDIDIDEFYNQTGLRLTSEKGGLNFIEMKQFLNRLLSLKTDYMNRVFSAYQKKYDEVIERHINNGTLDKGIETLRADKVEKVSSQKVYTHKETGAETHYVEIDATRPADLIKYEEARDAFRGGTAQGIFQNISSGRVWVASYKRFHTDPNTGSINEYYALLSPARHYQTAKSYVFEDKEKWRSLTDAESKELWNKEYADQPKTVTDRIHMITGVILPIWDRIKGSTRIIRTQTDEGETLLGRMIDPAHVTKTLQSLQAELKAPKETPAQIVDKILKNNYVAELANGWIIKRVKSYQENRIEIDGPDYSHMRELTRAGVFTEVIDYDTRFFIPTGEDAAKIFKQITESRPVLSLRPHKPATATFARAAKEAAGIPVEQIKNTITPILKNLKGLTPGVNVVSSISELSPELQKEAGKVAGAGVKAVFDSETNEITLVAEGLSSIEEAQESLFHELYGHYGPRKLFGRSFDPFLAQVYNAYGPKQLQDIADLYGLDFSKREDRLTAAEEKLARMAGKNEKPGLLKRVYAYIKNWLRKMGFNIKLNDDDLKIIVGATKRAIEEGYDIGELRGAATRFAREKEAGKAEEVLKQFPVKYEGIQKGFLGAEDVVVFRNKKNEEFKVPVSEFNEEAVRKALGIKAPSPQMGFRFAKEKEVSPTKEPMAALPSQVRPRIEAARGIPKPTIVQRLEKLGTQIMASTTRHWPLLDPKEHGFAISNLRRFQEIPSYAKDAGMNHLKDVLSGLTPQEYDAFSMNLLLSDMMHDIDFVDPATGERLLDPGKGLPYDFMDRTEVVSTLSKFKKMAEENPKIKEALAKRKSFMSKLKKDLIDAKFLNKNVVKNEDYWHHQVLEYMQKKYKDTGIGGKDVRTHKKGWMISRIGSIKDYNTEYAESEFEVVSQGLAQLRAKEIIDEMDTKYNIIKSLRAKAKDKNTAKLWEVLRDKGEIETDELGKEIDPLKPFSIKIAMGFGKLGKLAADGELYGPVEYEGIIDDLAASHAEKAVAKKDYPEEPELGGSVTTDNPLIFQFLSYLINSNQDGAQAAATIFNGIRERNAFIKAGLGKDFTTWKNLMPEDYSSWKPKPHTAWFITNAINDKILEGVIAGNRQLTEDDAKKILARGMDLEWVIPTNIADTMDDITFFPNRNPIQRIAERSLNLWKQYILINPLRIIKYNTNNLSGDADITLAYDPKIIKNYSIQAAKDLWKYHYKYDQLPADLVKEMDVARKEAVIGSGMTIHDIPDVVQNLSHDNFMKLMRGEGKNLEYYAKAYWEHSKRFTTWRENVLRLAAFRYFKDRIRAGEKNIYGVSNPDVVDDTPFDGDRKAALLARDLLGDYGNITQAGQWLRRKMIPFFSWLEINAPRYYKLFRNLPLEGRGKKGAISMASMSFAKEGAALAFRASMLYGSIMLWNMIFFPDEERELGESGRRQLHIILPPGRRGDGSIVTLRFQGALSDALEWIGMEDAPQDMKDLLTRKMSFYDLYKDAYQGFVNKFARGIRPDLKMALMELPTGKSTYPDIFKSRPIRDKLEHIARTFSLDIPYRWAAGKPLRGKATGGRLMQDIASIVSYRTDPGEMAYYDTRKLATDYLEDNNLSKPMVDPTTKSNALYYYKRALKFADLKAAEKYLKQYQDLGGTTKGLKISIKLAHPMSSVPIRHRKTFFGSLTKGDREKVKSAIKWYEQTYRGRKEAA